MNASVCGAPSHRRADAALLLVAALQLVGCHASHGPAREGEHAPQLDASTDAADRPPTAPTEPVRCGPNACLAGEICCDPICGACTLPDECVDYECGP